MSIRSRNWILTINYKESTPILNDDLLQQITELPGIVYTAFQLEQGEQGTQHHQLYISFENAKSFNTIKKYFPTAHIENSKGSPKQCSDYCTKDDTRTGNSIVWGELPRQGKRTDMQSIYDMLKENCSIMEIRELFPSQYMQYSNKIKSVEQELIEEKYRTVRRILHVSYLWGDTGVGKTRHVMDKYGYENVYRVSNYKNPFDTYKSEPVIIFEEFRASIPIEQMLIFLEGYPLNLPARYSDKTACYTKVYIISNWDFYDQFVMTQIHDEKTYEAFKRRINFIGDLESLKIYEELVVDTIEDE